MNIKLLLLFAYVFLLVGSGCSMLKVDPTANSIGKLTLNEFTDKLSKQIPSMLEKYNVAGISITLVHKGKIAWSRGFGFSNIEGRKYVTTNTIFQAASISKSLTALGIMKLVQDKKINLDDPVEKHLTRWHLPPSNYDHNLVTIRRLLNHTAGISVSTYFGFDPSSKLPTIEESLNGNLGGVGITGFFGNLFKNCPGDVRVIQHPGLEILYSGGGYTILQLLIEEVTGQSFSSFMKKHVFDPLEMINSSFELSNEMQLRTSTAYNGLFFRTASPNYSYTAKAAAGLYTTSRDLGLFLESLMTDTNNSIITAEAQKIMLESSFGVWPTKSSNSTFMIGHNGYNIGDWYSAYKIMPKKKESIVILTNSTNGDEIISKITGEWISWVIADDRSF